MVDDPDRSPEALLERVNQVLSSGIVPHNTALGLIATEVGRGYAIVKCPYHPDLVGNPTTGVLHGGVVTSLLDATAGFAVLLKMDPPTRIATLDLRIDYLSPATPGRDLFARVECYKLTKYVAFARGVAYHDTPADPIASTSATFMIFKNGESGSARALDKT
jgi:uncharacterized protein (TIGR00369 family)